MKQGFAFGLVVAFGASFAAPASAAVLPVTNTHDSGPGSLRQAIVDAEVDPAGDLIDIQTTGTVSLLSALPDLGTEVDMAGPGAGDFNIRRGAGGDYHILGVTQLGDVSVSGVTLSHGSVTGLPAQGGGVVNLGSLSLDGVVVRDNTAASVGPAFNPTARGGGIYNAGSLDLTETSVRDNEAATATDDEFAQVTVEGGGIYNEGTLTLDASTVNANDANGSAPNAVDCCASALATGGGIQNDGTLGATNSTVSGNGADVTVPPDVSLAGSNGGGIAVQANNTATTLRSVTLAFNAASGAANSSQRNGAIFTAQNTIIAQPQGGGSNCSLIGGAVLVDNGHNLDDDSSCGFDDPTDHEGVDPLLEPLADNGGSTQTHALPKSSPAVDQGTSSVSPSDQRGFARPFDFADIPNGLGDGSDIGAFELTTEPEPPVVTPSPPSSPSPDHCAGEAVTIHAVAGQRTVGTAGRDVILGTAGPDVIRAGTGDDVICGIDAGDRVRGGSGRDEIDGGDGDDRLRGGRGHDVVNGGPGSDRCRGGADELKECER